MAARISSFQVSWLSDSKFSAWIKKHATLTTQAICKLCSNKVIDISRMGASALVSHSGGARNKQKASTNPLATLFFAIKLTKPPQ